MRHVGIDHRTLAAFVVLMPLTAGTRAAEPADAISIEPAAVRLTGPWSQWQLVVTAAGAAGPVDVAHEGQFRSLDERIARVSGDGLVRPVAAGTTQVEFRRGRQVVPVPIEVVDLPPIGAPSYRLEILPALTKLSCNSGKCHGAPSGKAGFALSLRGFDIESDHQRLTHQAAGRRVNPLDPPRSLILQKATGGLSHGGGRRMGAGDALYAIVRDWVAAGAPPARAEEPAVVALRILPQERWLPATANRQQLSVVATLADGSERDVTHLAHLSPSDAEAVQISSGGLVARAAGGEVAVAAAYCGKQATAQLVLLQSRPRVAWPDVPERNPIDRLVFAKLRRLGLAPSPLADDATFLRRAHLDVCGVLPTPDEVRAFLADASADKRAALVDRLLARPEFAQFWGLKWSDRLGCNQRFVGKTGAEKYHAWIVHQMAANAREDELVRSLLVASGGNYGQPAASFWRLPRTPEERAEHVAQVFLGLRIGCARCHNHPGEAWSQDDYYGFAAYFARLKYRDGPFFNHPYDKEEMIVPTRGGELVHGRTHQPTAPRPLGGAAPPAAELAGVDRRQLLADWLASRNNRQFARAMANLVWFHLFGRGIVEPVDDFRSSNPPANAELLEHLADEYIDCGFDRQHLIRYIGQSSTYQLASATNGANADDQRYFSHYPLRRLGAEQLLDAIGQAADSREKFAGFPATLRAAQLADGEQQHAFLAAFGRPARSLACACERDADSNLGQALELVGGKLLDERLRDPAGRAARLVASGASDEALVEELFLATLGRFPSSAERQAFIGPLSSAANRQQAAEDILWTLVNHREFVFQH